MSEQLMPQNQTHNLCNSFAKYRWHKAEKDLANSCLGFKPCKRASLLGIQRE
jgi:hypothetical protein